MMPVNKKAFRPRAYKILPAVSILTLAAFIIIFPVEALEAAGESVKLWFNRALPSLLPFMIGINILSAVGFTQDIGKWLANFMKIFGVPGEGGVALAAGMSSGYPMGAKLTAQLRENGILTQTEAQRLLSFVNNSGPLFILGTVGVGMFNDKRVGYFLMLTHYSAAFITGLLFRTYSAAGEIETRRVVKRVPAAEDKPLGIVLSGSVMNAMESMALIGGFIIFFGVLCKAVVMIPFFSRPFASVLSGVFEMTNGLFLTHSAGLSLKARVLAAAALISFGGLSIHAQTISMIGKTDIKPSLYLLAKIVHGLIALGITYALYPLLKVE
ncbi:MAG: hypothetical protein LBB94_09835 [Clostridiales bacterium]|jgi:sporulation integral membrane protein YlbJ|nr:hypothetical protein [Clostridiales bacterium]